MAKISRKDTINMAIRFVEGATNVDLANEFDVTTNTINTIKSKPYWQPLVDSVLAKYVDFMVKRHLDKKIS